MGFIGLYLLLGLFFFMYLCTDEDNMADLQEQDAFDQMLLIMVCMILWPFAIVEVLYEE